MFLLNTDPEEPYVPFMSSRHSAAIHELRRQEPRVGSSRRFLGRAIVKAGLAVAGRGGASSR